MQVLHDRFTAAYERGRDDVRKLMRTKDALAALQLKKKLARQQKRPAEIEQPGPTPQPVATPQVDVGGTVFQVVSLVPASVTPIQPSPCVRCGGRAE